MLIIKDWKGLIAAGISSEQDMVIKHFHYFGPVAENLCKRIRDEDWRAVLRGTAQAARCRGYGAAGGKNEILNRGRGIGRTCGEFCWEGATWIPNAVPRWSRFLLTCFGHGGRV